MFPLVFVLFRDSTPSVLLSNGFLLFHLYLFLFPAIFYFCLEEINLQGLIISSANFVITLETFIWNVVMPIKLIMTVCCKDKSLQLKLENYWHYQTKWPNKLYYLLAKNINNAKTTWFSRSSKHTFVKGKFWGEEKERLMV